MSDEDPVDNPNQCMELVREMARRIHEFALYDDDVCELAHQCTALDLGRECLEGGDSGDDPLWYSTLTNVITKALNISASQMFTPVPEAGDDDHWIGNEG